MTDVFTGYHFKKFNMKKIDRSKRLVFIGKSGSGKTWLIRDTMYKLRDIPEGICIAGTKAARDSYKKFLPDTYI